MPRQSHALSLSLSLSLSPSLSCTNPDRSARITPDRHAAASPGYLIDLPHRHHDDHSIRPRIETHRAAPLPLWKSTSGQFHRTITEDGKHVEQSANRHGIFVARPLLDSPLASWFPDDDTWAEGVSAPAGFFASSVSIRECWHLPFVIVAMDALISFLCSCRTSHLSIGFVSGDSCEALSSLIRDSPFLFLSQTLWIPFAWPNGTASAMPPCCGVQGSRPGPSLLHRGSRRIMARNFNRPALTPP
ncbi:hypothetical protein P171DRAFT_443207 [Karstenula rhodostoma CBS 690.94]|uniref:Uncharacterized protein n=1 Tax=Karstenula rhodostoma CBS 690.94 TaxID=1392251 RepID=A0A9P4PKB4_9PLEO|nr:hypothetical protein P171DRAFT_443207 [Karstenula rhodostoma CBS 690.94]